MYAAACSWRTSIPRMPEPGSASYTSVTWEPIIPNSVSTPSRRKASTRSRPPVAAGGHPQAVEQAVRVAEVGDDLVRLEDLLVGGASLAQDRHVGLGHVAGR